MSAAALDARLQAAQAAGDGRGLAALYAEAAAQAAGEEARAFYLTHALVHALEAGDPSAARHRAALAALGRETPG